MNHSSAAMWMMAGLVAVGVAGTNALGQSVNIRFGAAPTTPSSSYGAAGLPGVWNSFPATGSYVYYPLVGLAGTPIAAQYYQSGSQSILSYNNPLTTGDDERLMDSMYLSNNTPSDGCFWVAGLIPGPYEVTIYAMTPNDPTLMTRTRVDNGSPGQVMVGGTWPGHHQQGVTYSRFTVTTTDGTIGFHDGLAGTPIQSGMNGAQLRFLGPCATPTISTQPVSASVCSGNAAFSIAATGAGTLTYQWQIETAPGVWQGMGNDPGPLPCGGGAFSYASPINSPSVHIGVHPCPGVSHYQIRCVVSNACGGTTSNQATLTLNSADFNGDGDLGTDADIEAYFACLAGNCCATCGSADFNGDGDVGTDRDIESFFSVLGGGSC
jgi:hypothetical protein